MKNPFSKLIIVFILCLSIALMAGLTVSCASANTADDVIADKDGEGQPSEEDSAGDDSDVIYVLSYSTGGGNGTLPPAQEGKRGQYLIVADCKLTNNGLEFLGWSDGKTIYQPGDIYVMKGASLVLSATWESVATFSASYTLAEDNTLILSGYSTTDSSIVIPSIHNGKYVSGIATGAFSTCDAVTSLTLPASLQNIAEGALAGMSKLVTLDIPFVGGELNGAQGEQTFFGYIFGKESFANTYEVNDFCLPKNLSQVNIGGGKLYESAFAGCYGIRGVTLPGGVATLPTNLFEGAGITKINLPSSVTYIESGALNSYSESGAYALQSITVDSANPKYSALGGVLYSKDGKTLVMVPAAKSDSFTVPATVTSIASGAMTNVTASVSLVGSAIKTLGANAFAGYKGAKITLGKALTAIEEGAFMKAENLSEIALEEGCAFVIKDGVLYSEGGKDVISAPQKLDITAFTADESVRKIYKGAFYNVASLTSAKLTDSVYSIGESAFEGTGVEILNVPYSVYYVGAKLVSAGKIVNFERTKAPLGFEEVDMNVNYAVDVYTSGDWTYTLRNNTSAVLLAYNGTIDGGELALPSELGGNTVVSLGSALWEIDDLLTAIALPTGLTKINAYAFANTSGLSAITLPDTVSEIDEYAFAGIQIGGIAFGSASTLTKVNAHAFDGTVFVNKDVTLPKYVSFVGEYAFANSNVTAVNYSESKVIGVEKGVFFNAYNLTSIGISLGTTSIGAYAFAGCVSLGDIDFTKYSALATIGTSAFEGDTSITSISVCNQTISIGERAFAGCSALVEVKLPSNDLLAYIGDFAFENCSSIKTFTVKAGMRNLGEGAFEGCYRMIIYCELASEPTDEFTVWKNAWSGSSPIIWNSRENYVARDNSIYFHEGENLYRLKNSQISLVRYGGTAIAQEVKYGVSRYPLTTIMADAFAYSNVEELVIPSSIIKIEEGALRGASKLKSLTINFVGSESEGSIFGSLFGTELDDGMVKVEQKVAIGNTKSSYGYCFPLSLTTLTVLGGTIESGELSGLYMLSELCLGEGVVVKAGGISGLGNAVVRYAGASIPSTWSALWNDGYPVVLNTKQGNVIADDGYTYELINGNMYRTLGEDCELFAYNPTASVVKVESFVTGITAGAFKSCNIKEFTLAEGVTAFMVENGILYTADGSEIVAFPALGTITSFIFPIAVTKVHAYAFYGAKHLTAVTIGEDVAEIGEYAFYGSGITLVVIPTALTELGAYAFAECKSLTAVTIPYDSKLEVVDEGAFMNCSSLVSVTELRGDLTQIDDWAFAGCASLTSIFIPNSVVTMGAYVFYDCGSLTIRVAKSEIDEHMNWDGTWNYDRRNVEWGVN